MTLHQAGFMLHLDSTLPKSNHMPTQLTELYFVCGIASSVTFDLLFPKCAVGLWYAEFRAVFMAVPEAPMNKDHGAVFRQHDVRPVGQKAVLGAVHRESVAKPV